jgi:hypothetical protein
MAIRGRLQVPLYTSLSFSCFHSWTEGNAEVSRLRIAGEKENSSPFRMFLVI